jgi:hypothetical protein
MKYGFDAKLPWRFPTDDEFAALLISAGFEPDAVRLVPRPTFLPSGMDAWLRTFAATAFAPLGDDRREAALRDTVELLRPALRDSQGRWTADYMRLRFSAVRAR